MCDEGEGGGQFKVFDNRRNALFSEKEGGTCLKVPILNPKLCTHA
jgi:hypothetical protein